MLQNISKEDHGGDDYGQPASFAHLPPHVSGYGTLEQTSRALKAGALIPKISCCSRKYGTEVLNLVSGSAERHTAILIDIGRTEGSVVRAKDQVGLLPSTMLRNLPLNKLRQPIVPGTCSTFRSTEGMRSRNVCSCGPSRRQGLLGAGALLGLVGGPRGVAMAAGLAPGEAEKVSLATWQISAVGQTWHL